MWKRKRQARAGAVLGLLAVLCAAGCGGAPKMYYYTLQPPATPVASDPKTDFVLGVEHFRAPEILRDDRLVYYVSPTQINYYQHHRWGSDPATLLSEFTARWLESSGVFAQVKLLPVREHVDYTLGGRVLNFEEVDAEGAPKVRMVLILSLVRTSDHKRVWSSEQREETPLSGRGVEAVASALNAASAQVLQAMAPGLLAQVEKDFQGSAK